MPRVRSTEPSLHTERILGLLLAAAVLLNWCAIAGCSCKKAAKLPSLGFKELRGGRDGGWSYRAKISWKNYQGEKRKEPQQATALFLKQFKLCALGFAGDRKSTRL